jgi:ribonuclease Z
MSRAIVSLASLLFGVLALGIWAAPERAATLVGVEAVRAAGTVMLRAELGGLFAGMAILCGVAAVTKRRAWIASATTMLAAIVTGRTLGWMSAGRIGGDLAEMAVELAVMGALLRFGRAASPSAGATVTASPASRRWRVAIAGALVAVPAVGLAAFLTPGMQQRIYDAGARRRSATINTAPLEDDALRVAVCGSSAPLPSHARAKACVAVFAGGRFYVVDVGPESVENLLLWNIPMGSVGGVLLTHFHSDHIGDLGELQLQTWAGGRSEPLAVYGGPGVERVVAGFNEAYRQDQGYRTAHHGEKVMPSAAWGMVAHTVELDGEETPAKDRTGLVLDDGALRITAIEVDHAPITPAYAFRFDYRGRSVVVSGDLKNHPPLAKASAGADLLVCEAIAVQMTKSLGRAASAAGRDKTAAVMHDIENYHITPEQAAQLANQAGVKLLAFYHLLPAPDGFLARRLFAHGVDRVRRGDWTIADDGSLYTLPLDSQEVRIGRICG